MIRTFDFAKVPIADIINDILVDSTKRGASDIHFDPYEDHLLIRIRIDGVLMDYATVPDDYRDYLTTRVKTISKMNITESRLPQDGAIKETLEGIDLDLRVSSLPVSTGEKIVIRILDYTRSMAGLGELGFSEENYKKVLEMLGVPNGIILVTGATGSGKSTTVYSMLQQLNTSSTNIITVEDPIEMDITGINQVQTNPKIGLTFASALRSILRQDPNIIMIGEIRDTETAKIAVRASITGHLVFSTLHTNTSLNTIERLIDMDVQKYLLASALEGVISQKLARQLCPKCKRLRKTSEYEKMVFKSVLNKDIEEIYDAEGCEECHDGYKGRIAIHEVLRINQQIRDALSNNRSKEEIRKLVYGGSDVITMLEDGLEKVIKGYTTFEEILKLIELEDDDKISSNSSLSEAIIETKEAIAAREQKSGEYMGVREELAGQNIVTPASGFENPTVNQNMTMNIPTNNFQNTVNMNSVPTNDNTNNFSNNINLNENNLMGQNFNNQVNVSNDIENLDI